MPGQSSLSSSADYPPRAPERAPDLRLCLARPRVRVCGSARSPPWNQASAAEAPGTIAPKNNFSSLKAPRRIGTAPTGTRFAAVAGPAFSRVDVASWPILFGRKGVLPCPLFPNHLPPIHCYPCQAPLSPMRPSTSKPWPCKQRLLLASGVHYRPVRQCLNPIISSSCQRLFHPSNNRVTLVQGKDAAVGAAKIPSVPCTQRYLPPKAHQPNPWRLHSSLRRQPAKPRRRLERPSR